MATGSKTGNKLERKYLAHFVDSSFGGASTAYVRLGKDLESYTIEMNPDSESTKNILGETSTIVKGYEPQGSVETYYAREGDALYTQLDKIINERLTGSELETTVVDVTMDSTGTVVEAWREDAIIIPTSKGGDTGGVQIPFEVHYNGNRTKGTFDMETKKFTEAQADGE